jgi:shikimate kinase
VSVITPGRNIVLAGLMGSGKSTVGRILAERLGRPLLDTDAIVEKEAGRTIPEIFAEQGERGFRDLESEAVRAVSTLRGRVISVGGGAILSPANVTHLRSTGDIVVLDAPPEVLAERVGTGEDRPLLEGQADPAARLGALRAERDGAYRAAAAVVLDTSGKTPEEVADAVLTWARNHAGLLAREERAL